MALKHIFENEEELDRQDACPTGEGCVKMCPVFGALGFHDD